jgi:hypothetical protein
VTVQLPAPVEVKEVAFTTEHPAVPLFVTLKAYVPEPVPPDAVSEMAVLKVPLVEVNCTAACVALPIVTVVARDAFAK